MVVAETLPSGLRLVTESMPHVRSVTVGVWLTRGSRHETDARERHRALRRAHAVQGDGDAARREDIAQAIDSIGGQLDAFTAKEYASYYIKVLDEHLPLAVDILSRHRPAPGVQRPTTSSARRRSILEEIKMVEDTPDDLVHELFTQQFWDDHPLGRPILGTPETVESFTRHALRDYFRTRLRRAEPDRVGGRQPRARAASASSSSEAFGSLPRDGERARRTRRRPSCRRSCVRQQGARAEPHLPRHAAAIRRTTTTATSSYVLNTMLGGSMSSRLFQNVREKRGLAYAVFSGLSAYRDAGILDRSTPAARTRRSARSIDLVVEELRELKRDARAGRRAPAREGSPEGQPHAEPREHVEPHVAPGAPGDLLRSAVRRSTRRSRASSA